MGKRIRELSQTVKLDSVGSDDFFAVDGNEYGTKKLPASDIKSIADAVKDISTIRANASKGATAVQPSSLSTVATSGSYNDLKNKPSIPSITGLAKQSDVTTALSGKQDTISDLDTIRTNATAGSTAVQPTSLSKVATSGNYNDLSNKPSIPDVSGFAKSSDVTTALAGKQDTISDLDTIRSGASKGATSVQPDDLSSVATSGSYNDLTDKPTIPNVSGLAKQADVNTALAGKQDTISDLDAIRANATAGSTAVQPDDLSGYATAESVSALSEKVDNLPTTGGVSNIQVNGVTGTIENGVAKVTIPVGSSDGGTTVVQADWNAESGVSSILNKPDLSSVATSGSYNDLTDKPSIPSITGLAKQSDVTTALSGKQDTISDLDTIRTNASKGATAVQPDDMADVATSGSYNDLTDKPSIPSIAGLAEKTYVDTEVGKKQDAISDLSTIRSNATAGSTAVQPEDLASVATSGSYNDLTDKPSIPSITGLAKQSDVTTALSGKQDTISDLPTIRSNASKGATAVQSEDLSTVATSGSYNDLTDKPSIPSISGLAEKTYVDTEVGKKQDTISDLATIRTNAAAGSTAVQPDDLASVATSGSYNDLTDKPTIPATSVTNIQVNGVTGTIDNGVAKVTIPVGSSDGGTTVVQADWNAESGVSSILNKPDLATVATSGSYNDLADKPSIPSVTGLAEKTYVDTEVGKKQDTISDLSSIRSGASKGATSVQPTDLASVATSGSYNDLTDKPTIPSIAGLAKSSDVTTALSGKQDTISDLTTIRSGASKGATSVQSDDLADVATSGSYNDLTDKPSIPSITGLASESYVNTEVSKKQDSISDLTTIRSGASKGATAVQPGDLADVATSGSYNDLTDKPSIPSIAGLAKSSDVTTALSGKQDTISDLDTIRTNATAGSTAVQPEDLSDVATSGSYNDLSDKPTIPSITGLAKQSDVTTALSGKQDTISDLSTIRSNASSAFGWGDHATAGYESASNLVTTVDDNDEHYPSSKAVKSYVDTAMSGEATTRSTADTELDGKITSEATARSEADTALQNQIDAISSRSDVVDVVGTHAELVAYSTTDLGDKDVIKVLSDNTNSDATAYYRFNKTTGRWSLIGTQGPYYTKSEVDTEVGKKQDTISDLATIRTNATAGSTAVQPDDLADVATSGSYNDLTDKPSIPSITGLAKQSDVTTALSGKQDTISDLDTIRTNAAAGATAVQPDDLSSVATSGSYNDLSDKPTIPSVSGLAKQSDVTTALSGKQDTISDLSTIRSGASAGSTAVQPDDLADVATSGSYNDLTDKPSIPSIAGLAKQSDVTTALRGKQDTISDLDTIRSNATAGSTAIQPEDLSTVATSGSYNDLTDKPSIPSIAGLAKSSDVTTALSGKQDTISDLSTIRSGASAGSTAVQPDDLSSVATSGSYNDLSDKPSIPSITGLATESYVQTYVSENAGGGYSDGDFIHIDDENKINVTGTKEILLDLDTMTCQETDTTLVIGSKGVVEDWSEAEALAFVEELFSN